MIQCDIKARTGVLHALKRWLARNKREVGYSQNPKKTTFSLVSSDVFVQVVNKSL
jgi:hypothetical protein